MSTQEDREWDERQEWGWAHPLAPWMRESAIIADQLGEDDSHPVDNPVETPGQTTI